MSLSAASALSRYKAKIASVASQQTSNTGDATASSNAILLALFESIFEEITQNGVVINVQHGTDTTKMT